MIDEEVDAVTAQIVDTVMQAPTSVDEKLRALASAFQLIAAVRQLEDDLGQTGIFVPAGQGLMRIAGVS